MEVVMQQQAREISTLRVYEEQLSHMTHALSKMEGVLRQEQDEKVRELSAGVIASPGGRISG